MPHAKPPQPVHIPGTKRGEEMALEKKEPGRKKTNTRNYRTARDSTGINARQRDPLISVMPNIPPA
jgi:hypothetical protein